MPENADNDMCVQRGTDGETIDELSLRALLKERLLSELDGIPTEATNEDLEPRIEEALLQMGLLLPKKIVARLARKLSDDMFGLGPLEALIRDPSVSEIMVNGASEVFIERDGIIEKTGVSLESDAKLVDLVRKVIAPLNLRLDDTSPMVDARLSDGSRLNAVLPPVSRMGTLVTIRRFRPRPFSAEELVRSGSMTAEVADFLREAVEKKANILISGGASSGKTTLLNLLASFVPHGERLITIEDAAELKIEHPHIVSLEARPPNIEGRCEVTLRDLVRNSLRMRPDRIIVGEVRGPEALDMLQAMHTGHPGSLSTAHANSPLDLLFRLETMVLMSDVHLSQEAVRRQVGSALDLVVHTKRTAAGSRILGDVSLVSTEADGDYVLEHLFSQSDGEGGSFV